MTAVVAAGRETSRREQAKEGRRSRIVKATYELLREVGYDELSVKLIADRAEVSPATVYNLFGTKGAVLDKVNEVNLREFEAMVAKAPSVDALDRVFDAVTLAAEVNRGDPAFYRSVMWMRNESDGQGQTRRARRPSDNFWTGMARTAQAEGHLRPDAAPALIGMAMTQLASGVFGHWAHEMITEEELEAETAYGFAALLTAYASPAAKERLETRLRALEKTLCKGRG